MIESFLLSKQGKISVKQLRTARLANSGKANFLNLAKKNNLKRKVEPVSSISI
jgi:hypothetical protein